MGMRSGMELKHIIARTHIWIAAWAQRATRNGSLEKIGTRSLVGRASYDMVSRKTYGSWEAEMPPVTRNVVSSSTDTGSIKFGARRLCGVLGKHVARLSWTARSDQVEDEEWKA